MRIIAGKYKGHPLVSFKADHIRPTTDRVKETQFNILQFEIENTKVLDLFCGTGNLGLEALSRGAVHVTFVDLNKKSIEITKQNIEKLKIPKNQYQIINQDVMSFLKNYNGDFFDIIFADPPFTESLAHEVMENAGQSAAFGPHTIMTIESYRKERIEDQYQTIFRHDAREFGDKILSFFKKKDNK